MKTIEKIEAKGYKVIYCMSGNTVFAEKNGQRISASNITKLYKLVK